MIGYSSVNQKGQITIPQPIREKFDIHSGDKIIIKIVGNDVILETESSFFRLQGVVKNRLQVQDDELEKSFAEYLGTRKNT